MAHVVMTGGAGSGHVDITAPDLLRSASRRHVHLCGSVVGVDTRVRTAAGISTTLTA